MTQPIAIDLFCGLGGWTEGLLAAGYYVVGFDIERHEYGEERYPAQLVLQDVKTIHGRQFKGVDLIVASPPCQEYSYRAMPWKRAKALPPPSNDLFDACFRIQREACEAAGRHIPLVVENVRGAQKWVGRSRWNYGSFHLWGDVPALMPIDKGRKNNGGSWFGVAHNTTSGKSKNPVNFPDGRDGHRGNMRQDPRDGVKFKAANSAAWFDGRPPQYLDKMLGGLGPAAFSSKSSARKRASAMIAKIPFALSHYIARHYLPEAGDRARLAQS